MSRFNRLKKPLALVLSVLLGLSCVSGLCVLTAAADDMPDVDAPSFLTDDEHDTGFETIDFAKNGMEGSPYCDGHSPFGYYFRLDESKKLTQISVTDHATYSSNVNKGTYALYQWQGDYKKTVASQPIVKLNLVNAQDHNDLILDVPAELNVTGELFFEVTCVDGAGYTPWIARGGLIDPIPGVVTDMQAYQKGSPSHAFACMISVADMVNQSPVKFINWTYDFGKDLTDPAGEIYVTHKNQISIGKAQNGYTAFTAEGADPYFRIPDDKSPTQKANELAYVAILYRTKAAVSGGEFFTNHGGATWGGEGTYASTEYVNDGLWHVALADASTSWGTDTQNTLFAFRFDPLLSGCEVGDTIDVAWLKFFGNGDMAKAYVDEQNLKLNNARQSEREAGTRTVNFTAGRMPEGCEITSGTTFVQPDFVRLMSDGGDLSLKLGGIASDEYRYARIIYRAQGTKDLTISSGSASAAVQTVTDGFWTEADLDLDGSMGDKLTLTFTAEGADAWADLAVVVLCSQAAYRNTYLFDGKLNTHLYVRGEVPVPVLTCTAAECGSPYCGPGEYYGQKITSDQPVHGIVVYNNSTWQEGNNEGSFKLWSWKGSYKDTVGAEPLRTQALKNLPNNHDLDVRWDEPLDPGVYYYEVRLTGNAGNAYTGFASKDGKAVDGCEAYRSGSPNGVALYAAYLTMGVGLKDLGEEYSMNPTVQFDFTRHIDSATEAFKLTDAQNCTVTDLCDKGYLTVTSTGVDPFFTIGAFSETQGNLCDWIVIKYRTSSAAKHGEFFVCRTDGVTWGQDYARSNVLFDWENDGEWHVVVVNAAGTWGNAGDVGVYNLRFDPLEKPDGSDETIDVASITFFANGRAADAYADSLYKDVNGQRVVPAPRVPLTPDQIHPVLVLDGEKLNAQNGNQMTSALYSYTDGCIRLISTGEDPYYYLLGEPTKAAPYAVIRYRTSATGVRGEIYAGSEGKTSTGKGDRLTFDYISDGQWHNEILDLTTLTAYDQKTGTLNYLRYDFFTSGSSPVRSALELELEFIAFFNTEDEAYAYTHTLPSAAKTFTLRFYADDHYITSISYKEGAEIITLPVVPKKPGMIGTWEAFTPDGDHDVHAVYTPASPDESVTLPAEAPTEPATQPATDPKDTEADTDPSDTGCTSLLPLSVLALMSAAGLCVVVRRRED